MSQMSLGVHGAWKPPGSSLVETPGSLSGLRTVLQPQLGLWGSGEARSQEATWHERAMRTGMICEAMVEGGRTGVSRGGWHTLTSAIFHFSVTDWLQMGPCRLFSAVLVSVPTGCILSSRPLGGRGLHPNCQNQEASGCYKRTLIPKDPLFP